LQHHGRPNPGLQLRGQLTLLGDAVQHRLLALFQMAQVFQASLNRPELLLVQPTGDLLAVSGDEGHGVVLVQQLDSAGDLASFQAQFLGDGAGDEMIVHSFLPAFLGRLFDLSGEPAPDQLHLEAVSSIGWFNELTPQEQVKGEVQIIGELVAQVLPADYCPFPLRSQEAQ